MCGDERELMVCLALVSMAWADSTPTTATTLDGLAARAHVSREWQGTFCLLFSECRVFSHVLQGVVRSLAWPLRAVAKSRGVGERAENCEKQINNKASLDLLLVILSSKLLFSSQVNTRNLNHYFLPKSKRCSDQFQL